MRNRATFGRLQASQAPFCGSELDCKKHYQIACYVQTSKILSRSH